MYEGLMNLEGTQVYVPMHSVVSSLAKSLEDELGRRYCYRSLNLQKDEDTEMETLIYTGMTLQDGDEVVVDQEHNEVKAKKGRHPLIQLFKSIKNLENYAFSKKNSF